MTEALKGADVGRSHPEPDPAIPVANFSSLANPPGAGAIAEMYKAEACAGMGNQRRDRELNRVWLPTHPERSTGHRRDAVPREIPVFTDQGWHINLNQSIDPFCIRVAGFIRGQFCGLAIPIILEHGLRRPECPIN